MISQNEPERKEYGGGHAVAWESRQNDYCQKSKLTSLCINLAPSTQKCHQITQHELTKTPILPGHLEAHKSELLFVKTQQGKEENKMENT